MAFLLPGEIEQDKRRPDKWADLFGEEKKGQSPDPTAKELPSTGVASSTITQSKTLNMV